MDWRFHSQQDLVDAGYKFRGFVPCPVCGQQVGIWQVINEFPVFLNPETHYPHLRHKHEDAPPVDHKSAAAGEKP